MIKALIAWGIGFGGVRYLVNHGLIPRPIFPDVRGSLEVVHSAGSLAEAVWQGALVEQRWRGSITE